MCFFCYYCGPFIFMHAHQNIWMIDYFFTSMKRSFTTTYPGYCARQNRRVAICAQYDGGLAHSCPIAGGIVLLHCASHGTLISHCVGHSFPVNGCTIRLLCGTSRILGGSRINRHRRCRVFKRPIDFIGIRFSRFIFCWTESFPFVNRRWLRCRMRVGR